MSDSTTQNGKSPRPAVTSATLRKRRWVLVGAVLLVPFAMEAAVRAAGRTGLVMHTEVGKRQQRAQPPLTHRLKKGARVEVTYAPRNGPPIRTAVMTINKLGMRGALPRGGRPLVACIGDSHTFGYGVSDHETWPVVLEKELLKKTPQIEVINFGVGGYGPHQELVRLRDDALPYEPDIVLWQWFMNDIDPRSVKEHRTALQRRVFRLAQPFRTDWVLDVREKSVLIDLALHTAYVWARNNSMVAEEVVKAAEGSERWNRALDALRELGTRCDGCGLLRTRRDRRH